jgi:hypothetical protein
MVLPLALTPTPAGTAPTGLLVTVTGGSFTLVGVPAATIHGAAALTGAAAPLAQHTITIPVEASVASPFTAAVAAGQLQPGYLYRATAALTLSIAWHTAALPAGLAWGSGSAAAAAAAATPTLNVGGGGITAAESTALVLPPSALAWAPAVFAHAPPPQWRLPGLHPC